MPTWRWSASPIARWGAGWAWPWSAAGPLDLGELRGFCRGRIAAFKLPEWLLVLDEIPYNDFGKVDRRALPAVGRGRPVSAAAAGALTGDAALGIYSTMATIRAAEDRITKGLRAGELRMTFYQVRGQEAIPAAVSAHLRRDDYMVTTYRGMHDCIAKGMPLDELLAEMCGQVTGTSKGKGGPMHLSDPQLGPHGDHRRGRRRAPHRLRAGPGQPSCRGRTR